MLQIKSLSIYHKKDLHALLKDFSFVLKDGEKVALIGDEGNGKSTLLKLIYNPALIESYAEYSGESSPETRFSAIFRRSCPKPKNRFLLRNF